MDKQVYDLSYNDLANVGVWYFPMDESVEDEATVRPVYSAEQLLGFRIIIRSVFKDSNGGKYLGYMYWGSGGVEDLQPTIFLKKGGAVNFWSGMREPSWRKYPPVANMLKNALPISCMSEFLYGLPSINITLNDLAYFRDGSVCWVS